MRCSNMQCDKMGESREMAILAGNFGTSHDRAENEIMRATNFADIISFIHAQEHKGDLCVRLTRDLTKSCWNNNATQPMLTYWRILPIQSSVNLLLKYPFKNQSDMDENSKEEQQKNQTYWRILPISIQSSVNLSLQYPFENQSDMDENSKKEQQKTQTCIWRILPIQSSVNLLLKYPFENQSDMDENSKEEQQKTQTYWRILPIQSSVNLLLKYPFENQSDMDENSKELEQQKNQAC